MSTKIAAPMGRIDNQEAQPSGMPDRTSLRLSAALLFVGVLLSLLAGMFHAGREPANTHAAAFAEYASSGSWIAAHLGQFAGMAVLVAGLLVLFAALDVHRNMRSWAGRFGAIAAVVALALYAVLQAVDGVALKHAVDAWAGAPEADKAARFASAEAIRWLEWSLRSYFSFMLGLSLVLCGTVVVGTATVPRAVGVLMGVSGLAYIAQGWVLGVEGFSATNAAPTLLGIVTVLVWSLWLLMIAWRLPEAADALAP